MKHLRILLAVLAACLLCALSISASGLAFSNPPIDDEDITRPIFTGLPKELGESPVVQLVNAAKVKTQRKNIDYRRKMTWSYQDRSFVSRTRTNYSERKNTSIPYLEWVAKTWNTRLKQARHYYLNPPHHSEFLCIHHYEQNPTQGWATNTGNGYYGGIQMDRDFMRTYGGQLYLRKGTADHWTPLEQIWVAERAFSSGRGFRPWPNTARSCGLL